MTEYSDRFFSPQSVTTHQGLPKHGRLSVTMQRRPSVVNAALNTFDISAKRSRVVLGRPARVFWDLDSCHIAGRDYMNEIIRSIEIRVAADTRQDSFEIYAGYSNASHIPAEVFQELLLYDVNFNFTSPDRGTAAGLEPGGSLNDIDLYVQIGKYIEVQSRQTHLFPYVLLISGSVNLINRLQDYEKQAKIVYALRKEKASDFRVGNLAYEYTATKGIENFRTER
ncbi:hypothetical protein RvY_00961 [Ramazzottius varieornatus]|uniref:NYN domain-containing protein n=1 Tax=Ramazzottius varieornatus TaxID=947166 RepID=A0A1D1UFJ8_RAMVA|nr:hypothetical protein RvY_00961 [Ramazzottius varieornatus]